MNTKVKQLTINYGQIDKKQLILSRILPLLLYLSFVWLNIYKAIAQIDRISPLKILASPENYFVLNILFSALFSYIIFELLFVAYRLIIGFSIYSYTIPKQVLANKFRGWFILRNIVLGFFLNARFFLPFINLYLLAFEILIDLLFIICLYFNIAREYVDALIGQFVFRAITLPFILYEIYNLVSFIVRVM